MDRSLGFSYLARILKNGGVLFIWTASYILQVRDGCYLVVKSIGYASQVKMFPVVAHLSFFEARPIRNSFNLL